MAIDPRDKELSKQRQKIAVADALQADEFRSVEDWQKHYLPNGTSEQSELPQLRDGAHTIGENAANVAIGEREADYREATKPRPETSGVGEYCQPGDRREPRWIVMYDDADRSLSIFEDEQDARDCFANSEAMGWNCWLFSPTTRAALTAEKVAGQEPYGYAPVHPNGNYFTRNKSTADYVGGLMPVYAAPQQPAQPVAQTLALTDEQILDLADDHDSGRTVSGRLIFSAGNLVKFARALLREAGSDK